MADESYNTEEWRDIPGWDGRYEASSLGRVRSVARVIEQKGRHGQPVFRRWPTKMMRQSLTRFGYYKLTLCRDGREATVHAHRLVCAAFHGECPAGRRDAEHLDGDKLNNRPGNLRWATSQENQLRKREHGVAGIGEKNGRAILTAPIVSELRRRMAAGEHFRALAAEVGVSDETVHAIKMRRNWKHVA